MLRFALKMLIGNRAKYIGIVLGLAFSSFIITQQAAIFLGLMSRTHGFITDTAQADVWVMHPRVRHVDDTKPLNDTDLFQIRGIDGVEWAVPMYKGQMRVRLDTGNYQSCTIVGIDDASLIGGPPIMIEGAIENLRETDGVILNEKAAYSKLALPRIGSSEKVPLRVGDTVEINDKRASIVGLCKVSPTFQTSSIFYTTYKRAIRFAPKERKLLTFVLVKAQPGITTDTLKKRIQELTGLAAYSQRDFEKLTITYYMKNTGIPVNFGIAVLLGLIIGAAIAGQTFFNFIMDNIRYLAVFKAMGADHKMLIKMTLTQVAWVGIIGWGLGIGFACLFGYFTSMTELAFLLPWQLAVGSFFVMLLICLFASLVSLRRVFKIETAIVFKT